MTQGVIEDEGLFTTMDVVSTDGYRQNVNSRHIGQSRKPLRRGISAGSRSTSHDLPLLPSISFCAVNVVRHFPKRRPDQ
jgi:hypothetical protein